MTDFELDRARIVVIGAGIIGASTAYHLVQRGEKDVLLLDRHQIGEGTSWHSPGLVGLVRLSNVGAQVSRVSRKLYQEMHDLYGDGSGWHPDGGLRLAQTADRAVELRTMAKMAEAAGTESEIGGPEFAQTVFPALDTGDVRLAVSCPDEGWAEPFPLIQCIVDQAVEGGLRVLENTMVTGFDVRGNEVKAIRTWRGSIECEQTVIAAGVAANAIAAMAGVGLPMCALQNRYCFVEPKFPIEGVFPVVRNNDSGSYFRRDPKGVMAGGDPVEPEIYEADDLMPRPRMLWDPERSESNRQLAAVERRLPATRDATILNIIKGPDGFTPDYEMLIGETSVRGLWSASPGCGHGVAFGGGIGRCVAELILDGESEIDVSELSVGRFPSDMAIDLKRVQRLSIEAYCKSLDIRPELL